METVFVLYHSKSVIKVLVMLNKYKHICVICRQTGSLAQIMFPAVLNTRSLSTQVVGIANRQRASLPKLGKVCSLAFYHSSGHLSFIYLCCLFKYSTACLCFKPLEYILTIFLKRTTYVVYMILSRYIVLDIKFTLNTWLGLDVFQ